MATTPAVETPIETAEPELSLAEHAAQFGPDVAPTPPEPEAAPPEKRHRAKSQIASADDFETVKTLTKRLREAEDAVMIERQAGESDRVYQLRKRAEIAEARRDALHTPPPSPIPAAVAPAAPPAVVQPVATEVPALVKPNFENFKWGSADPEYLEALTVYNVQTAFKAEANRRADDDRKASEATRAQQVAQTFTAEVAEATKRHPDFHDRALKAPTRIPVGSIMDTWIMNRPKLGAEVLYYLQDPANEPERVRLHGLDALAQIEELTLLGQRLIQPFQAVSTGSVARVSQNLAPTPPNPVRTGPTRVEDEPPGPDEDVSVATHAKYYGPKRRH